MTSSFQHYLSCDLCKAIYKRKEEVHNSIPQETLDSPHGAVLGVLQLASFEYSHVK